MLLLTKLCYDSSSGLTTVRVDLLKLVPDWMSQSNALFCCDQLLVNRPDVGLAKLPSLKVFQVL